MASKLDEQDYIVLIRCAVAENQKLEATIVELRAQLAANVVVPSASVGENEERKGKV